MKFCLNLTMLATLVAVTVILTEPVLAQEPSGTIPTAADPKPDPKAEAAKDSPAKTDAAAPCDHKDGDCDDKNGGCCGGDKGGGCCDDDDDDDDGCCEGGGCPEGNAPCDERGADCCPDGKHPDGKPCPGKDCAECEKRWRDGDKRTADGKPVGPGQMGSAAEHGGGPGLHQGPRMGRGWQFGRGFGGPMIRPYLLLQTQVGLYAGKNNQQTSGDAVDHAGSFVMRRARAGAAGHISPRITWAVSVDFAQIGKTATGQSTGLTGLNDAFMSFQILRHQDLVVGAQVVPFSRFATLGSGDQALAQRPKSVDAMAPFRQLGVMLHGHYDLLGIQWWVGAYNSYERNVNFYDGIRENSWLGGSQACGGDRGNGCISTAARLQLEPFGSLDDTAADRGWRNKKFRMEVGGGYLYNSAGANVTNSASGDIHLKWFGAHILLEYLWDTAKPKDKPSVASTIPDTVSRTAFIAELGYALWMFNAAVRYEKIDPNTEIKDNRDESVISAALGWQLPRNRARIQLQYDHRAEVTTPALDNDTVFAQFQVKL